MFYAHIAKFGQGGCGYDHLKKLYKLFNTTKKKINKQRIRYLYKYITKYIL